jgi:hypothetical protein
MFHVPEKFRITSNINPLASDSSFGNNGAFAIGLKDCRALCIASDGMGWKHVSAHIFEKGIEKIPTWEQMCILKDLFWDEDDCVMQLHPPKKDYINNHKNCLHLWRPIGKEIPTPDPIMVGIKNK